MGKVEKTHQRIIVQSAPLFNQYGYSGTSIQEIMSVTGLKKGGIYSHFPSKEAFASVVDDPPVAGGCAILNTAIESDDAHLLLKRKARQAMDEWFGLITRLVSKGVRAQEFRPGVNGEEVATTIIASVEGALMMSKLYDDPTHMERVVRHLRSYLAHEVAS